MWGWKGTERMCIPLAGFTKCLTNVQRAKKNMVSIGECERCREGMETVKHVLRVCHKAASIKYKLLPNCDFNMLMCTNWEDWMLANLIKEEVVNERPWSVVFGVCCWMLGGCKNKEVIGGEECQKSSFLPSL